MVTFFSRKSQLCNTQCVWKKAFINPFRHRFPDFLVQLQNYNGPPKILCEVVKPKPTSIDIDNGYAINLVLFNDIFHNQKLQFLDAKN